MNSGEEEYTKYRCQPDDKDNHIGEWQYCHSPIHFSHSRSVMGDAVNTILEFEVAIYPYRVYNDYITKNQNAWSRMEWIHNTG